MEFKTPTEKSAKVGVPLALGAILGGMLSNGITSAICKPAGALPTPDELKKKSYVQMGMVGLAIGGLCAVTGSDMGTSAVTGVLAGVAGTQSMNIIATQSAKSTTVTEKLVADTKTNTFLKSALGLGCPCSDNTGLAFVADNYSLNRPKRRRGMKGPDELEFTPVAIRNIGPSNNAANNAINNWRSVA